MQTRRPLTTSHERQRLRLWALAMLAWLAALVCGALPPRARQWRQRRRRLSLAGLRRTIVRLMIVRAAELKPLRARKRQVYKHGRSLLRRHFFRSLIGARIRKAMRGKHVAERIAKLMTVLRDLDRWALAFAKRRAVTRLWFEPPHRPLGAFLPAAPAALSFADTS